ncbi:MAG: hypothetical protein ABI638_13435 [Ignavibacteriota bacterium]
MEDNSEIVEALYQLFDNAKNQYGDAIENYWFNDSEDCPACSKRIDAFKFGEKSALSLNAFIYRDMNTLIAYLLCGKCAKEIFRKSKQSKSIYKILEDNLKLNYTEFIKHSAS